VPVLHRSVTGNKQSEGRGVSISIYLKRAPSQSLDCCLVGVDLMLKAEARVVDAEDVVVASAGQLPSTIRPLEAANLLQGQTSTFNLQVSIENGQSRICYNRVGR